MITIRANKWIVASFILILSACGSSRAIQLSEEVCRTLLLDERDFPQGWSGGKSFEFATGYGSLERCAVSFDVLNGTASQVLFRYGNETLAERGYESMLGSLPSDKTQLLYDPSPQISAFDASADDADIGCRQVASLSPGMICVVTARYGTHTLRFNTYVGPSFMTEEEFGNILLKIDKKLVENLPRQDE